MLSKIAVVCLQPFGRQKDSKTCPAETIVQIFDTPLYEDQAVLPRDQTTVEFCCCLWTPKLCSPGTILVPQ